jgi:protoporphyrinogen oxidase
MAVFDVITQELMARIKKNKGVIKTGISIENIKNSSDKKVLLKIGGRSQRFDKAIAAVPNNALVKMIGEHNFPKYSKRLNGINYLGAVVLVFTSKQSLSQYYWHNI